MNLIELSIRRPVFAWVLMFAIIVFGAISLNKMGISQLPDVDFPIINVSFNYDGAAPEVVEAELVDPIEERLLAIEGIKDMRSEAKQGSGRVTLEFDINRNVDVALQEVQTALSQLRLPLGIDPPTVRKQNPEEDPITYISISGKAPFKELLTWTDNYLLDQLRFLPGVGEVSVGGYSDRNLRIWLDTRKLDHFELTITDVVNALKSQHAESAAGQFTQGKRELRVRWLGEASTVDEVKNIRILRRGGDRVTGRSITIKDVADVEDGLSDIRRVARVNGVEAIGIAVKKQRGTNEVEIVKAIRKKLEEIKGNFPKGYEYKVIVDFTKSTQATIDLNVEKIWVAGLITILICFLFLGSFQAALNILFSIPTSIVGTFTILYLSGFTLNLFTLLALTLSISIVVDDAIMLLENIVRHYRMGKNSTQAAYEGAMEVLPAAVASSLAVIAVFLPVVFMDGIIGKFFFQFGVTMCACVLLSLLEAVVITPMRAAALLSSQPKVSKFEHYLDHTFEKFSNTYRKMLSFALEWKYSVVILSLVFFMLSIFLAWNVRQEFVPQQDQDMIIMNAQTKPGTSISGTTDEAIKIENILKENKNVLGYLISIGGGPGATNVNQMLIPIILKPRAERKVGHVAIMNDLRAQFKQFKELKVTLRDNSGRNLSSGRQNPIGINIRGPELDLLDKLSQEIISKLENENLGVDLDTDFKKGIPELILRPNREAMAERGVSVEDVGQILSSGIGSIRQGRFTMDGDRYDIRFKIRDDLIKSPEDFKYLYVRNNIGNLVPMSELVSIAEGEAIQGIARVNRQRAISIFGNLAHGVSQSKVLKRAEEIAKELLPPGYSFALEGASAGFASSFKSLTTAFLFGILVAFLILAVQFNSFVHPFSVLIALPFSISGALVALWMFGVSVNLFSFIGLIVLMGISKKNSIMLVEFSNRVRSTSKESVKNVLLIACPVRLRPILMTSTATIAAAVPLVLGHSLGAETRLPMGLAIIGGTLISTVLTLFVVPALYLMMIPLERKKTIMLRDNL